MICDEIITLQYEGVDIMTWAGGLGDVTDRVQLLDTQPIEMLIQVIAFLLLADDYIIAEYDDYQFAVSHSADGLILKIADAHGFPEFIKNPGFLVDIEEKMNKYAKWDLAKFVLIRRMSVSKRK